MKESYNEKSQKMITFDSRCLWQPGLKDIYKRRIQDNLYSVTHLSLLSEQTCTQTKMFTYCLLHDTLQMISRWDFKERW